MNCIASTAGKLEYLCWMLINRVKCIRPPLFSVNSSSTSNSTKYVHYTPQNVQKAMRGSWGTIVVKFSTPALIDIEIPELEHTYQANLYAPSSCNLKVPLLRPSTAIWSPTSTDFHYVGVDSYRHSSRLKFTYLSVQPLLDLCHLIVPYLASSLYLHYITQSESSSTQLLTQPWFCCWQIPIRL